MLPRQVEVGSQYQKTNTWFAFSTQRIAHGFVPEDLFQQARGLRCRVVADLLFFLAEHVVRAAFGSSPTRSQYRSVFDVTPVLLARAEMLSACSMVRLGIP
jgi:hypothetical protein